MLPFTESKVLPFTESKAFPFQLHNNITQLATSLDSLNIVSLRLKATCLGHLIRVNGTLETTTWVLYRFVLTVSACFLHSAFFFVISCTFEYFLLLIFVVLPYRYNVKNIVERKDNNNLTHCDIHMYYVVPCELH